MSDAHRRLTLLCAVVVLLAPICSRAQYTWIGGATGAGSLNFNNAANWSGGIPVSNSNATLTFAGTQNTGTSLNKLDQNIASPFVFKAIDFASGAGPFFIKGSNFAIDTGAMITQNSASDQYIEMLFAHASGNNTNRTLSLTGSAGGTGVVTLAGPISDASATRRINVSKTGSTSTYVFASFNSFSGGLNLSAGTLGIAHSTAMGNGANTFAWSGGTLALMTDTALAFNSALNVTTVSGDVDLVANRATTGPGMNHLFGDLNIGANRLTLFAGGSINSGLASVTFGSTTLTSSGATFDVGTGANLTLGAMSGDFNFTKQGQGTLTLSGTGLRNGNTAITAGTVVLTNAKGLSASGSSSVATVSNAALQFAGVTVNTLKLTLNSGATLIALGTSSLQTQNASIGNGAAVTFATAQSSDTLNFTAFVNGGDNASVVTIAGPGTVSLQSGSAAAGYAGSWNVNGTSTTVLKLGDVNALGNPGGGNNQGSITLTTGTLHLRVGATAATFSQATKVAGSVGVLLDTTVTTQSNAYTLGTLNVTDALPATNALTLMVAQASFNANNAGSLIFGATTLTDSLNLVLNNTSANATGGVTLGALNDGGVLKTISKSGNGALFLTSAATSLVDGTALNITGGVVNSNANNALGSLANVTISTGATFSVGASQTVGALNSAVSNTGSVNLNGNTLTVGSSNNLNSVFAGTFGGSGGISKEGNGAFTLTGTQTYTGTTSITAGRFINNGTLASGGAAVTVGDGINPDSGMLLGSGTILRSVTIDKGGSISPGGGAGGGVGILRTNAETWNARGTYVVEINDFGDTSNASAGTKFDQLQITGALILNATSLSKFIIDITSLNGTVAGNALNFDKLKNYSLTIATVSGAVPDLTDRFELRDNLTNDHTGVGGAPDGGFSISGVGTEVVLKYSAAPEPAAAGVLSLIILPLLMKRPKRRCA